MHTCAAAHWGWPHVPAAYACLLGLACKGLLPHACMRSVLHAPDPPCTASSTHQAFAPASERLSPPQASVSKLTGSSERCRCCIRASAGTVCAPPPVASSGSTGSKRTCRAGTSARCGAWHRQGPSPPAAKLHTRAASSSAAPSPRNLGEEASARHATPRMHAACSMCHKHAAQA